jgi:hypothetical protein
LIAESGALVAQRDDEATDKGYDEPESERLDADVGAGRDRRR